MRWYEFCSCKLPCTPVTATACGNLPFYGHPTPEKGPKGDQKGPKGTKRSRNVSRLCARSDCTKKPTGRKSSITAALQLSSFCCQELCLVLSSVPLPTLQENSLAMMKLNISKPTTAARAIHAGAHAPLAIYNSVAISRTESAHMEVFRAVCLFGIHW